MPDPNGKASFAKKSLGQNFLTDPNYIRRIIDAVDPNADDIVIEIGPGRGALTELLVASGASVIAIELDSDLSRGLIEHFRGNQRFQLVETDALSIDFRSLANRPPAAAEVADETAPPGTEQRAKSKLVANLPYYISTAVLQRLAAQREVFSEMVLMFQKEVVDRLRAAPGDSKRGFLTVVVEAAFHIERLFDVPPSAFSPSPKIWSSVARLTPKPLSNLDNQDFLALLGIAFSQKRKTLLNNLKLAFPDAVDKIRRTDIDPKRRAETLSLEEWERLYRSLVQT